MTRPSQRDPQLDELMAEHALGGVAESERDALAAGGGADPTYELAAAAADLSTLRLEEMPPALRARLLSSLPTAAPAPRGRRAAAVGWLAAAVCAGLAALGWLAYATKPTVARLVAVPAPILLAPPSAPRPDPAADRARLLARAPDVVTLAWGSTKDPAGRDVHGDVVWSEAEQQGFMRFSGLPANDPLRSEYQLWIFDRAQDNPVDGGVFDVLSGTDEVVVPIHAKLSVKAPTLFAVTVERPGGVVVSKKEHIVAVAPVKTG